MPNTIAENLQRLAAARTAISNAIITKGGTVNAGDGLEEFPNDINTIPTANLRTLNVTENGTYYESTPTEITSTSFPITLNDSLGTPLLDYLISGDMSQSGTPTPTTPIQPQDCGEKTENMFDCTRIDGIIAGSFINQNGNIIKNNEYYISYPIYVMEEKTYTWRFNADSYNTTHTSPTVGFYDASNNLLSVALHNPAIKYFSFNIPNGCKYIRCSVFTRDNAQRQAMLNLGSTPLPYEPYGYKIPISSANTTTPVYLGEVETMRRIKKLVLTGEETDWLKASSTYTGCFYKSTPLSAVQTQMYCTHLPYIAVSDFELGTITISESKRINLWFEQFDNNTTVADFKTYLATQYAAGTPVIIWYVLAEPETAVVNEPLRKIDDYADTVSGITIPTIVGANTIDVDTTLKPSEVSINYHGWHPMSALHKFNGTSWD